MRTASVIINAAISIATLIILILNFRKDGTWQIERGLQSFRFFTVLSNAFCGIAALIMVVGNASQVAVMLKYLGTVSVTVTLLTVFLFRASRRMATHSMVLT